MPGTCARSRAAGSATRSSSPGASSEIPSPASRDRAGGAAQAKVAHAVRPTRARAATERPFSKREGLICLLGNRNLAVAQSSLRLLLNLLEGKIILGSPA